MGMTERQLRFADEYIIDLNATRAYKAAYPNVKSDGAARVNGSRLLAKTNVKTYIDERLAELQSKRIATAEEVLEHITAVIRRETREPVPIFSGDGEQRVEYLAPTTKDVLKAAELLGKRYRLFTDKTENTTTMDASINITIDYGDDDET